MDEETVEIAILKVPGGYCVSLNDYRVAGGKPYGQGQVVAAWDVPLSRLREAIGPDHFADANKMVTEVQEPSEGKEAEKGE